MVRLITSADVMPVNGVMVPSGVKVTSVPVSGNVIAAPTFNFNCLEKSAASSIMYRPVNEGKRKCLIFCFIYMQDV